MLYKVWYCLGMTFFFLFADSLERQSSYIDNLERFIVLITTRTGWGTGKLNPSLVLTCSHVVQSKQG